MVDFFVSLLSKLVLHSDFVTNTVIAFFALFQGGLYFAEKQKSEYADQQRYKRDYPVYAALISHASTLYAVVLLSFFVGILLQIVRLVSGQP